MSQGLYPSIKLHNLDYCPPISIDFTLTFNTLSLYVGASSIFPKYFFWVTPLVCKLCYTFTIPFKNVCRAQKEYGLRSEVGTMWLHTSRVETLQPMLWMMRHFSSSLPFQHSNILNCIEKVKGGLDFSQEVFWTLGVAHVSCFLSLTVIIHDMFPHCLGSGCLKSRYLALA